MTGSSADGAMTPTTPRPGDRVRVTYACGVVMTSLVRGAGNALVLDIPGDKFVVRTATGGVPSDIVEIVTLPPEPAAVQHSSRS